MREMSAEFRAILAREDLALVYLFELTLKEGSVFRYTENVSALYADGQLWRAAPGIDVSAIRDTDDAQTQTATVQVAYADDMLTEQLARKGGLEGATFRLLCVDWRVPTLGVFEVFTGHVDKLTASNPYFCSMDLTGWQVRSIQITGVYSLKCRNVFCDQGCKLSIEDYSYSFTITGPVGQPIAGGTFGIEQQLAEGLLRGGSVLWTTGRNAGEVSLIAYNAEDQVELSADPPYIPLCGEEGLLRAGCDFYADTCENRYHNLVNFQAEPAVPAGQSNSNGKTTTTVTADPIKPPADPDPVQPANYTDGFPGGA